MFITFVIEFRKEAIKESENDFKKVKISPVQEKLLRIISKYIIQIIDISETAMNSIAWASMREWQAKNKKKIVDIQKLQVHEKLIIIKELFCIGREKLKDILASSKEQSELLLDIAFEKAFKLFLEYKEVQLIDI